ncbi:hypothetical protein ACOBQB_05465 [Streptomyces sp. G5(2025)]
MRPLGRTPAGAARRRLMPSRAREGLRAAFHPYLDAELPPTRHHLDAG